MLHASTEREQDGVSCSTLTTYGLLIWKVMSALALCLGIPLSVLACHCTPSDPAHVRVPQKRAGDTVFIGIVESVYPTDDDLHRVWKALFGRDHQENEEVSLDQARKFVLYVWGDFMPPSVRTQIEKAKSREEMDDVNIVRKWSMPKRIILRVSESFTRIQQGKFTVYTGWGSGDCGVEFNKNERWLVEAFRDDLGNWIVHKCSATALAAESGAAIRQLRLQQQQPGRR